MEPKITLCNTKLAHQLTHPNKGGLSCIQKMMFEIQILDTQTIRVQISAHKRAYKKGARLEFKFLTIIYMKV